MPRVPRAVSSDSSGKRFKTFKQTKSIAYGSFINTVIDFTIIAVCIFIIIKAMSSLKKKPALAAAANWY
jgi:large conductance mechanosensitive channel